MKVAKAESANPGVHRLEEIEVKEVSLVDRPANKRAFLIVKRSDDMTTQVTPDGKGGFTAAGGTTKAGAPPMPPGAGAAPGEGAAPPKKKKPLGKLDVPPGFKEMMAPMLAKASEALSTLADAVGSSSPAEISDDGEMPPVPGEFSEALESIMGTLDKLHGMWPSAPTAPTEGEAPPGEEGAAPTEMQMRATLDNVGKVLGHSAVTKVAVTKVGAKMAKDRFARLQTAYNQLGSLIGELGPAMAPAAPPAAGALGKAKDEKKDETEKSDLLKALEGMLAPIVEGLKNVGVVVAKSRTDIAVIQKSRGPGNGALVEKSGGGSPAVESHSWPMDMNAPVTKETVSKTESFFGND